MSDLNAGQGYPIYTGVWTNWSRGRILGATITLSHRDGALLTAFIALFVTFTGTSFWRIARFAIHQVRSCKGQEDGLYHQVQIALRNSENGISGLTQLLKVLWAWRSRAHRSFSRVIPLIAITSLITCGFAIAGILSAKVSSGMTDEVLISSSLCGGVWPGNQSVVNYTMTTAILVPYLSRKGNTYADYVQRCYKESPETGGCNTFIKQRLRSVVNRSADCPFKGNICRHQDRNIRIDSGPLDIGSDLGFNVASDSRYTFRFVTHCAPLATNGYKKTLNYSEDISYTRYHYGRANYGRANSQYQPNFTYQYQQSSVPYEISYYEDMVTGQADYHLGILGAQTSNGSWVSEGSTFLPIEELMPEDGDLSLIFLSANNILYSGEVNDDWYAAHRSTDGLTTGIDGSWNNGVSQMFQSDEPASPLGCKEQYQFCEPKSSTTQKCSSLGSMADFEANRNLSTSPKGLETISTATRSFPVLSASIMSLTTSCLTSRYSLDSGIQGPLPNNQWQLEVENWHNIALASLQGVADDAAGPNNPDIYKYFWADLSPQVDYLCKSQKIRSSQYSNFSVLGLSIILIVGGIIIILGFTLESIIQCVEQRRREIKYSRLEWSSNDVLQTQRMAHEELGMGTWDSCAGVGAIPVTEPNQQLAVLNISDPKHPRLEATAGGKPVESDTATGVPSSNAQDESSTQAGTDNQAESSSGAASSAQAGSRSTQVENHSDPESNSRAGSNSSAETHQMDASSEEMEPSKH